jgi:glucan 1,4-alpha-glucosidase
MGYLGAARSDVSAVSAVPDVADAPGAPGALATWTTGAKEGLGTSTTPQSKVWFTLTGGTLSEVYYPNATTPNVRELQFAVTDGISLAQRETDETVARFVALADRQSLTYQQTSTDRAGRWRLAKTYITDPRRNAVLIDVQFEMLSGGPYDLYVLYDPALAGDAGHDIGSTAGRALVASDTHLPDMPVATALIASSGFEQTSTGYVGASDGWAQLSAEFRLTDRHVKAGPGNIAQVGKLPVSGHSTHVTLVLGLASSVEEALSVAQDCVATPFDTTKSSYQSGWHEYLGTLKPQPAGMSDALSSQYWAAVMAVKAHEDKTFPGAFIASLTVPWGESVTASGASGAGTGYHFVWARDQYEQATGLLAAGDVPAAQRAVDWLFTRQQQADGHFPQSSSADGSPDQTNVQMDETALPIVLAWQVGRFETNFYHEHIAKAADYLVSHGPTTGQERWEDAGGYSPSTIAAEIAGLTAAAAIARHVGDEAGAVIYQATADSWQRQIEKWTYTTTGGLCDGSYYIRIGSNGNPDDGSTRVYANGAGRHAENNVVDAGFLELTRLGVKAPVDPYVAHSLLAVDQSIKMDTPSGPMWKRYTHDGYGETADGAPWTGAGIGRLWPLLCGERGEYVLANGGDAMPYLQTMANSANAGLMIPEQVWDQPDPTSYGHVFGKGTGSAAPLAWAMAQYVRLAQGIASGEPVETPSVVADRYANTPMPQAPQLTVTNPADDSTRTTSRCVQLRGVTDAASAYLFVDGAKRAIPVTNGVFDLAVDVPVGRHRLIIGAQSGAGGTAAVEHLVTRVP